MVDSTNNFLDPDYQSTTIYRPNNGLVMTSSTTSTILTNNTASRTKPTRYHFGTSSSNTMMNKINFSHRLPALEKNINHSLPNTMDLDEDLPINPVNRVDQNQRYTIRVVIKLFNYIPFLCVH